MIARTERASFIGGRGEMLDARLELPLGPVRTYALFAHCFTCSKDVFAASRISRGLARLGIAVLRFDFTGLGSSDGDFANTNFSSNVEDLVAAADFLRRDHAAPALLVGHSLGGAAVLAAASRIPESVAVATINAPSEPSHILRHLGDAAEAVAATGEATVEIAGRAFQVTKQLLDDVSKTKLRRCVGRLGRALLVMHAPDDVTVTIDHARRIFDAAKHPKGFVSLDGADHLLSRREDAAYTAETLATWVGRYLPAPVAEPTAEPDVVLVRETGEGRLHNEVVVGPHRLVADEPVAAGGTDGGPTPYDLVLAGLGACTSMTLRLYADRKGWPLDMVSVRLTHQKVHAEDCETCETKHGRLDRIDRLLDLEGALDADQRQRLLAIAEKCPVHRTLRTESWIVTRLGERADE